jgi:hypothetical protein
MICSKPASVKLQFSPLNPTCQISIFSHSRNPLGQAVLYVNDGRGNWWCHTCMIGVLNLGPWYRESWASIMGVWVSIHHVLSYPKSLLTIQAPSQICPWWIIASGWMGFWMGQPTALLIPSIISPRCSGKWSPHITKCSFLRLFNALPIQCKCVWMKHTGTSFCKYGGNGLFYIYFTDEIQWSLILIICYRQRGCLWRH